MDNQPDELISQGAEAKLYLSDFMGMKCIIKERFEKKYRVKVLDTKLTKQRMLNESRNIAKCAKAGINVPTIYFVDINKRKIYMQALENSVQLKDILSIIEADPTDTFDRWLNKITNDLGRTLAVMHSNDIIHGDWTPSNIILTINSDWTSEKSYTYNSGKELVLNKKDYSMMYWIDFGWSSISATGQRNIEDKAVDWYVLKRAIVSSNPKSEEVFNNIWSVYTEKCKQGELIIKHYMNVEMRGRKKLAFG